MAVDPYRPLAYGLKLLITCKQVGLFYEHFNNFIVDDYILFDVTNLLRNVPLGTNTQQFLDFVVILVY